jgi:hypothetical protein
MNEHKMKEQKIKNLTETKINLSNFHIFPKRSESCVIITSIYQPSKAIYYFEKSKHDLIIVGDKKTPEYYNNINCIYLDINKQEELFPEISKLIPYNHYCRKNFGYLYAILKGYKIIYDTDDDTLPYKESFNLNLNKITKHIIGPKYPNIYKLYSDDLHIWGRGYPLDEILKNNSPDTESNAENSSYLENVLYTGDENTYSVVNGLIDGDPDVDAIFRLTSKDFSKCIKFTKNNEETYLVNNKLFVPTNTQNTTWVDTSMFIYLLIPTTVSFRFCDILRSAIMYHGLINQNKNLAITSSNVYQERNVHCFMKDFSDEICVYLNIKDVVEIFEINGILDENVYKLNRKEFIRKLYQSLCSKNIIKDNDVLLLDLWLQYF